MGDVRAVRVLLEAGATVDAVTCTSAESPLALTPLAAATLQGRVETIRLLVERGASTAFLEEPLLRALDLRQSLAEDVVKALRLPADGRGDADEEGGRDT